MFEVMSIVYSTIKDDALRTSVHSILVDAKHIGTSDKAALKEEIDALRTKLESTIKDIEEATTKTLNNVNDTIPVKTKKEKSKKDVTGMRY
jgi:chemotaxis regulatin CheY-phosphate phosphatase CheZ